jgi:epoxyqueuosine reductase
MKQDIIQLIKNYTDTFFIIKGQKNKSIIMLIFGYAPFELLNRKEYAQIDPYYFISNESYHKTKKLVKELKSAGFNAEYSFNFNYKKLLDSASVAGVGKNTLCYMQNFGSRFVIQAIEIEGEHSYLPPNTKLQPACENCNLCKNACPTGAITDKGFDYKKCLRYLQENGKYVKNSEAKAMQNKLLGCDICQAVCPYNKEQKRVEMPQDLKQILTLENLLKIVNDTKKIKQNFEAKIGKNYARQKMLLPTLILISGNSTNKNLIAKLSAFKNSKSELVQKNLKRAVANLQADKNF